MASHGSVHSDDGAHVPWSYSTPTSLHNSSMRLNGRGFVSRSAGFRSVGIFTNIQPAFIPRCLQPEVSRAHVLRQPESLTCGVVHHSLVVACDRHTRVVPEVSESTLEGEPPLQLIPQRIAHSPTTKSDTAFCLLDQNLKSPPLWTSIPPLTERLSSRFAAQSLSVYAMILSDRTPPIDNASR